ncbi:oxalyl-CoA decarboxylase [bacterium]|nr:MAG: oxalyl-CoA decarboxylase [bacterium]MCL4231522.1 oxalyl-CoA decarboxylase [Dehalococcoidia bacterium]
MATIDGATIIARSLKQQGVEYMFGVVGVPVIPIAFAAQREGIKYFGFRNEQAASYAAGAAGYLTGRPGACLAVSGPGMVHAIAGLANAWSNCWPMILLGGANDSYQDGRGAFQEAPQVEAARPFSKYVTRPESAARLPFYIEQAVRTAIYGRPGAAYLDLAGDIISAGVEEELVQFPPRCPEPPRTFADPESVQRTLAALRTAERPLVVVGKGAAYARAEDEVRAFIEATQLPYLASPMGKGVLPDDHPLSVAPARSHVLQNADLVLLLGARLNWIMHFGLPPRWAEGVRVIQADIAPEEIGTNLPVEVALVGDLKAVASQLNGALREAPWQYPAETTWWTGIHGKMEANRQATEVMMADDSVPMGYYRVLREIRDLLPRDAIICSEGASTMDIGRTVLPNFHPRHRLDAGTFGTMGVGLGFAIAAAAVHPEKKVVAVEGDSAFGFSGMEVEVACRYGLPITFIIVNNNGIGGGPASLDPARVPPSAYTPNARYERIIEAFGGKGYFVETPAELGPALSEALAAPVPTIVNIMINPRSQRKPQEFAWHTR